MSEEQEKDIRDIIIHAQGLIRDTNKARSTLNFWVKIMIGSVFVAISVVSVLVANVKQNTVRIEKVGRDYAPLWVFQDLQRNNNYMVLEIAATFGAGKEDEAKLKELQKKYADFQANVINKIAEIRGGMTTITRSFEPPKNN